MDRNREMRGNRQQKRGGSRRLILLVLLVLLLGIGLGAGAGCLLTRPDATVFFISDYQEEEGFPKPARTLSGILEAVKADHVTPETFAFLGDYTNDEVLHDYQLSPEKSIGEIRSVLAETYPDADEDDMIFLQGNHDRLTESISKNGLHEYRDYLIYVLNTESDFPWRQGQLEENLDKVRRGAEKLENQLDDLIEAGETRPVFIAGHVPLHFTAKTTPRHSTRDNLYSSLVFDVVNEAAKDLDIVYLFGHNHSKGWDCYMGGSSIFRERGDILLVPTFRRAGDTAESYQEETLNFTYMNAGYTGYFMNCGHGELEKGKRDEYAAADETLTGTVCRIYPDKLEFIRYDTHGRHPLSWEGEANPYKGGIDRDLIPSHYYGHRVDSPRKVERKQRQD